MRMNPKPRVIVAKIKKRKVATTVLSKLYGLDGYECYVGKVPGQDLLILGFFREDTNVHIGYTIPTKEARQLADELLKQICWPSAKANPRRMPKDYRHPCVLCGQAPR